MLPDAIDFGLGVLDVRVLRARLRRVRRRLRTLITLAALLVVVGAAALAARGALVGIGTIVLTASPDGARVTLDGRAVGSTEAVAAGSHRLRVERDGFYPAEIPVTVTREQTATVRLAPLRPRPLVQLIPLPSPGSRWLAAASGDDWRLTAAPEAPRQAVGGRADDAEGLVRYALADGQLREAAPGVADEVACGGRCWSAWEEASRGRVAGLLTVTTMEATHVISTEAKVAALWWAPGGASLLLAEPAAYGERLMVWRGGDALQPLVHLPGRVVAVHWRGDGRAAVVVSARGAAADDGRYDASLVSLIGGARTSRLADPPPSLLGMPPLAWQDDSLLWVAGEGSLTLQRVPLEGTLPTSLGALPDGVVAIAALDGAVRLIMRGDDGVLRLISWPDGATLAVLDDLPRLAGGTASGASWQDGALLLATGARDLALVTFAPEALR